MTALRYIYTTACASLMLMGMTGCVLFVPFIKNDETAQNEARGHTERPSRSEGSLSRVAGVRHRMTLQERYIALYLRQLNNPDAAARTRAASALGMYGPAASQAVPALISSLRDSSKNVRRAAVKALGSIGSAEAIGPLKEMLSDKDRYVARSASLALSQIQRGSGRSPLYSRRS